MIPSRQQQPKPPSRSARSRLIAVSLAIALAILTLVRPQTALSAGPPIPTPFLVDYNNPVQIDYHNTSGAYSIRSNAVWDMPITPGTWYAMGPIAGRWRNNVAYGPKGGVAINLVGNTNWTTTAPYYQTGILPDGIADENYAWVPASTLAMWSDSTWIGGIAEVDPDPPGANYPQGNAFWMPQYYFQAPADETTLYYRWPDANCSDNDQGSINSSTAYNEDFMVIALYPLNFDTLPPTTTHTLSGAMGNDNWYTSPVTATLTGTDPTDPANYIPAAGIGTYYLDDVAYLPEVLGDPIDVEIVLEGESGHTYYGVDAAQPAPNAEETVNAFSVKIDTLAPTIALTSPSNGVVGGDTTIGGTASDATSGLASIEISTNNGAMWQTPSGTSAWSLDWDTTIEPDGAYDLLARAADVAGNLGDPTGLTVTIDNTGPTLALDAPNAGSALRGAVAITGTASDAAWGVNRIELSYNDGLSWGQATGTETWSTTWNSASHPDGPVTILARAVDNGGNVGETSEHAVMLDNTPPAVTISSPTGGLIASGTVPLGGAANDGAGTGVAAIQHSIDGITWSTATGTDAWTATWNTRDLDDGVYTLLVRGIDVIGNVSDPETVPDIIVDNTPIPTIITDPIEGQFISGIYTVMGSAPYDGSAATLDHVETSENAISWQIAMGTHAWSRDWDTTIYADGGPVTYYARTVDTADNTSTPDVVNVMIDNTPPIIAILDPDSNTEVTGAFRFSGTTRDGYGSGPARTELSFDDGATWYAASDPANWHLDFDTTQLPDDSVTVLARATDNVGLTAQASILITIANGEGDDEEEEEADEPSLGEATLTIAGSPTIVPGSEPIQWAVDAANHGPSPTGSAVIDVHIPSELTITQVSAVAGGYRVDGQRVVIETGPIPPSERVHFVVETLPGATAQPGQICASANFQGSGDAVTDCVMLWPVELPATGLRTQPNTPTYSNPERGR